MIARTLWDDAAFQNEPFSEREAWVWMICEAQWKPRQKRVGKVIVSLDRGQLAHSTRFLSEAWKWSHAKVRRFLDRLEKLFLIRRESGTGVSVITLCKYNDYQLSPQASDTEAAQKRHRSGTNLKKDEIREEEKREAKASPKKRGRRLPDDWFLPTEWGQWAIDEGWSRDVIALEADKFRDYWHGIAGAKGVKLDWQATWRNWMRNNSRKGTSGYGNGNREAAGNSATDTAAREITFAARAARSPRGDCF